MYISTTSVTILLTLAEVRSTVASFVRSNFSGFEICAGDVLFQIAPESCDYGGGKTLNETNGCLCSDSTYENDAATDIANECGCASLGKAANMLIYFCDSTNTSSIFSVQDLKTIGGCDSAHNTGGGGGGSSPALAIGLSTGLGVAGIIVASLGVWHQFYREKPVKASPSSMELQPSSASEASPASVAQPFASSGSPSSEEVLPPNASGRSITEQPTTSDPAG